MQYMQVQCAADAMHINATISKVKLQIFVTSGTGELTQGKCMHDASTVRKSSHRNKPLEVNNNAICRNVRPNIDHKHIAEHGQYTGVTD